MRRKIFLLTLLLCLSVPVTVMAEPPDKPSATKQEQLNRIQGVSIDQKSDGAYITVSGSQEATYSVFKLHNPLRLFVDISNSQLSGDVRRAPISVNNGVVNQVALLDFSDEIQQITRVIVGFEHSAGYDVRTEGDSIVIFVEGGSGAKSAEPAASANMQRELQRREVELERARKALQAKERQLIETEQKVSALEKALRNNDGTGSEVLNRSLDTERRKAEQLRGELASNTTEIRRLQESLKAMESTLGTVRDERDAANTRISALEEKLKAEQAAAAKLKTELGQLHKEQSHYKTRAETLLKERDAANTRAQSLASERDSAKKQADVLTAQIAKAKAEAKSTEAELAKAREALAQNSKDRKQALETADTLRSDIAALQKAIAGRDKGLEAIRVGIQKLDADIAAARKAGGDTSKLEKELAAKRDSLAKVEKRLQADQHALASKESALDKAIAQARSLDEAKTRATTLAAKAEQRHQAKLAKAQAADDQRLKALEDARKKEEERLAALEQAREAGEARVAELGKARQKEEERLAKVKEARQKEESARKLEEERLAKVKEARQKEEERLAKVKEGGAAGKNDPNGASSLNVIKSIHFQQKGETSRVVVEMSRPGNFQTVPWKGGKAKLKLDGVELPKNLERSLDTRAFGGTVQFVNSFQDKGGAVHVEAEIPHATTEIVRQDGSRLVWEFTSVGSETAQKSKAPAHGDTAALPIPATQLPTSQAPRQNFAPSRPGSIYQEPDWLKRPTSMARKRLDIDLRNADIQNVLRLFAREGNVNIVTGDRLQGSVTMRLQNVPIADAFLVILKSLNLGYEEENGIYRVDEAKVFEGEAQARRDALQASFPIAPLEVILVPVNYADARELSNLLSTVLSTRGSVTVDTRTNTLVVKDVADNITAAQQLVYSLDTQTPQILIEARIVETNDRFVRQFGIQWGGDWLFSEANGNPTGLTFPSVVGISGAANDGQGPVNGLSGNPNFAVNLPAPIGTGSGGGIGVTLGSVGNTANLALRLSALEEEGHIKIVSSPKIMTLDNRPAQISQGTSIPISVVSAQGVQTQFVQANLQLQVTPHVTQDGNVQMNLLLSKSEPDFENTGARGDPTIITKDAQTELMVADGDTTVIGGIYSQTSGNSKSKVPWLGDIPVLGLFFRNYSENETRTELLIFVTPRIINREAALAARKLSPVNSPSAAPAKDKGN